MDVKVQNRLFGEPIKLDKRNDKQSPMTLSEKVVYGVVAHRGYNPPTMREIEEVLFYRKPPIEEIGNKLRSLYKKRWLEKKYNRKKKRLVWIALPSQDNQEVRK